MPQEWVLVRQMLYGMVTYYGFTCLDAAKGGRVFGGAGLASIVN